MSDIAIVQLVGFLALLVGYVFKAYVDARNRKWDIEDRQNKFLIGQQERQLAATTTLDAASTIATTLINTAAEVKSTLATHDEWEHNEREKTNDLLKQGVEHAKAAYHEANNVNIKLKDLSIGSTGQIDNIEKVVETIKEQTKL